MSTYDYLEKLHGWIIENYVLLVLTTCTKFIRHGVNQITQQTKHASCTIVLQLIKMTWWRQLRDESKSSIYERVCSDHIRNAINHCHTSGP